jgi:hypothetical protein
MKLRDLDATFCMNANPATGGYSETQDIAHAQGVLFQCPACAQGKELVDADHGRAAVGAHYVLCWFKGCVPDSMYPGPGRWTPSGTGIDDLTLNPSVNLDVKPDSGCKWHGWVRNGEAA